jgi:hypothetical protein
MSRQYRTQQGIAAAQEERSSPGPESRGLDSVVDVLVRLRADTEDQIRLLASGIFRISFVSRDGVADTDCTTDQIQLLRSYLEELDTAINLANRDL